MSLWETWCSLSHAWQRRLKYSARHETPNCFADKLQDDYTVIETDIQDLERIFGLECINLSYADKKFDFSPLVVLTKLKSVTMNYCSLNSLSNIPLPPTLEVLLLDGNVLVDLTPLTALTQLKQLSFEYNCVNDLTPLTTLHNLEVLNCEHNEITDFDPISTLCSIKSLKCCSYKKPTPIKASIVIALGLEHLECDGVIV